MKIFKKSFVSGMRLIHSVVFVMLVAASVLQTQADVKTLTYNNSVATIDIGSSSSAGFNSWTVDGVNQLTKQWFYYRIGGSGPEASIDSISSPTVVAYDGSRNLRVTYANALFSVDISYLLTGNNTGSGNSGMIEGIAVKNLSGSSLDMHFFQYSDFNLSDVPGGQTEGFYKFAGKYSGVYQIAGSQSLTNSISITKQVTSVEAALYNQTLQSLADSVATSLNNVASAGPGNTTYTMSWEYNLAAMGTSGDSIGISETLLLQVPEPSAVALISSGIIALAFSRRRH